MARQDMAMNVVFEDHRQVMRSFAPQAVAMLAAIIRDNNAPEKTRLRAAKLILDLGYGRPASERMTCKLQRSAQFFEI
jgi:hypothetical protein